MTTERIRKLTRDEALMWIYDRFGQKVLVEIDDDADRYTDNDANNGFNSMGLEYEGVLRPGAMAPSEQHPNPSQGQSDEQARRGWFYAVSPEVLSTFTLDGSYDSEPQLTVGEECLRYRLNEYTWIKITHLVEDDD